MGEGPQLIKADLSFDKGDLIKANIEAAAARAITGRLRTIGASSWHLAIC